MNDVCVCNMVKDEIEILPAFYRYIKEWAGSWKVLDHGSTDGTIEFLERMKTRKEIDIDYWVEPSDNYDFYKECNKVLDRANRTWIFAGHIDEFAPDMKDVIPGYLSDNFAYIFSRYECVSINPLLAIVREPFVRLWKKEGGTRFKINNDLHFEEVVSPKPVPTKVSKIPYYHFGRVRNLNHIRTKEIDFEHCCGNSQLTSKYSNDRRQVEMKRSFLVKDTRVVNMLL